MKRQHFRAIKMLLPSHGSFHINLMNTNNSALCRAQIEMHQRLFLLEVWIWAGGIDQRVSYRSFWLFCHLSQVKWHRATKAVRGSWLALRNIFTALKGAMGASLLMLVEKQRFMLLKFGLGQLCGQRWGEGQLVTSMNCTQAWLSGDPEGAKGHCPCMPCSVIY